MWLWLNQPPKPALKSSLAWPLLGDHGRPACELAGQSLGPGPGLGQNWEEMSEWSPSGKANPNGPTPTGLGKKKSP